MRGLGGWFNATGLAADISLELSIRGSLQAVAPKLLYYAIIFVIPSASNYLFV